MTTSRPMQLGMVGLGRMGGNLARRLMRDGHRVVAYDVSGAAVAGIVAEGASGAASLDEMVAALEPPRAVWVMLPAGEVTERAVAALGEALDAGDTIIDGGNSYHRDDRRRARQAAQRGVHYVDCGTSGGVWGLDRGYCLMVGADDAVFARLEPLFESLAPGVAAASRTPGRAGEPGPAERGYLHCGPVGSGHFVKMVHNGIEYGLMAAYAEGLNLLRHADAGTAVGAADAETAPLTDPDDYRYAVDVAEVAELWRRGSVVGSWLLDLTAAALHESPDLAGYSGRVSDSGEGRWTSVAAAEIGIPTPVLTAALYSRFASRGLDDFGNRALSAMRRQFGGHVERPA